MGLMDDYHSWQDVDMNGVQIDPAGRLKRYTGSKMLSPARITRSQQPKQFGLRSSPQRILNSNHETDERDLRVLLGYTADAWASKPLREHFSKIDVLQPPRFVCLEGKKMHRNELPIKFHLGVSTFDIRSLELIEKGEMDLEKAVESHFYLVHDPIFHPLNSFDFLRGKPEMATDPQVDEMLKNLCSPPNILVTYGPKREHRALKKMGLDLSRTYVFDISNMAMKMFDLPHAMPLKWLLEKLGIEFDDELLHVAGNDAYFALRAMLLMTALDAEKHPTPRKVPTWVPTFRAIGKARLPAWDRRKQWITTKWYREHEDHLRQRRDIEHRIAKERYEQKKGKRAHQELVRVKEAKKKYLEHLRARAAYLDEWRPTEVAEEEDEED